MWIDEAEKIVSFHEVDNSELIYFDQREIYLAYLSALTTPGLPVPVSPLAHAILKAEIIWRLQMKHYLKALKQKNSLLFSVGIVMLLVLTLCLSGCSEKNEVQDQTSGADTIPNQSASAEEPSSILYVNNQLGFSMEMPLNWMGQVEVKEEYGLHHQNGGNCITFYHKPTHDNGEGGILFFIDCYPGEWSEDNPPVIAGHSVVVAANGKGYLSAQNTE